jgi:hypothetical protein
MMNDEFMFFFSLISFSFLLFFFFFFAFLRRRERRQKAETKTLFIKQVNHTPTILPPPSWSNNTESPLPSSSRAPFFSPSLSLSSAAASARSLVRSLAVFFSSRLFFERRKNFTDVSRRVASFESSGVVVVRKTEGERCGVFFFGYEKKGNQGGEGNGNTRRAFWEEGGVGGDDDVRRFFFLREGKNEWASLVGACEEGGM